jgi:hypothetical protein
LIWRDATDYRWIYNEQQPESFPGSTAVGVSRKVLTALKTKGEADLRVPRGRHCRRTWESSRRPSRVIGRRLGNDDAGNLEARGGQARAFQVILNDDPVELMAIHARGQLGENAAEFWILDDGDNPLALKWEVAGTRLHVIRLSYPENVLTTTKETGPATSATPAVNAAAGTAKRIEEDLAKTAVRSFTASTSTLRAIESRRNPSRCSPKSRKCCGRIRPGT